MSVSLIWESGGEAIFVRAEVLKAGDVEAMVDRAVESYGRADYAFNNADIRRMGVIHEIIDSTRLPSLACAARAWPRR